MTRATCSHVPQVIETTRDGNAPLRAFCRRCGAQWRVGRGWIGQDRGPRQGNSEPRRLAPSQSSVAADVARALVDDGEVAIPEDPAKYGDAIREISARAAEAKRRVAELEAELEDERRKSRRPS